VVDMAVGIIIAAPSASSSRLWWRRDHAPDRRPAGRVDFLSLAVTLKQASGETAAVTLGYGSS